MSGSGSAKTRRGAQKVWNLVAEIRDPHGQTHRVVVNPTIGLLSEQEALKIVALRVRNNIRGDRYWLTPTGWTSRSDQAVMIYERGEE